VPVYVARISLFRATCLVPKWISGGDGPNSTAQWQWARACAAARGSEARAR
jgi:hypothetical protein